MMKNNKVQARIIFVVFLAALGFVFFPVMTGQVSVHDRETVAIPDTELKAAPQLQAPVALDSNQFCETPNEKVSE